MRFVIELIVVVLAIAAWRRSERILEIERRLDDLTRRLDETFGPPQPAAEARPQPAPEPPLRPFPEPPPRPSAAPTAEPVAAVPRPAESPRPPAPPQATMAPSPRRPPTPRPSLPSVDWEQLFGVRGAALAGAVALGLAGLLFFRYSVEHGLFPPWLRVVVGAASGLGAIAGSEYMLRRRYGATANALAGGGSVVLYAAWWAAAVRYGLVPTPAGYLLMVLTTVATCALSWRHASQEIALLGLIGGFATPLLLSSGADRPIGLFAYVLALDVGLLVLARQRGWTRLAALCLGATALYEAWWLLFRLDAARLGTGLGVVAVFAVAFGVASVALRERVSTSASTALSAIGAVLLPCAFVFAIASRGDLAAPLASTGAMLVLLTGGACWLGPIHGARWMGVAAATAAVVVPLAVSSPDVGAATAWQLAAIVTALALLTHCFVEREPEPSGLESPVPAALVAAFGGFVLLGLLASKAAGTLPMLAAATALVAMLARHATFPGRAWLLAAGPVALGWLLAAWHVDVHGWSLGFRTLVMVGAAVALGLLAASRADAAQRRFADHGAAAFGTLALLALALPTVRPPVLWTPLGALALTALVLLAAARRRAGGWVAAAVVAGAWADFVWAGGVSGASGLALAGLAIVALTSTAAALWPLAAWPAFARDPVAWRAAALAGPAWFWSVRMLFLARFGAAAIGLVPLALAGLATAAATAARRRWPEDDPMWSSSMAWLGAVALGFVALAIPMQLDKEWITIGWALQGLAVVVLWTRVDHPGLKYAALGLFVAATARLVVNPAVLAYHPRPAWRIVNWLAYTYLVPAAALGGAASLLAPREDARLRPWEPRGPGGQPLAAGIAGISTLVVVFVWLNLAVADWFATGAYVSLAFERLPARDLATSIAWAAYALVLLALGVWRTSQGLRWASLVLVLGTIAKVFLHDLGELEDLYRVASLVGLAVSLFLVSLAYQRFVFRAPAPEEPAP